MGRECFFFHYFFSFYCNFMPKLHKEFWEIYLPSRCCVHCKALILFFSIFDTMATECHSLVQLLTRECIVLLIK